MTQSVRKLTFEEYVNLNAEDWWRLGLPEGRCEYVDGESIKVPSESELNDWIALELFWLLALAQIVPRRLIRPHSCEIEVPGKPQTRFPDLVILREEHLSLTQRRLFITLDMQPPQLVVEVVSPGDDNRRRDYEAKREQYQQRGIPEYWLLDPSSGTVGILVLQSSQYMQAGVFQGNSPIESKQFPQLQLTPRQILSLE